MLTEISQMDIPLFKGIKKEDMGAMLSCTGYHISDYAKGQVIALENEQIRHVGIVLSGAVEPIAAVITLLAAGLVTPVMPYFLAFAAGAMMYVVVEELIPEMSEGKHSNIGTIAFSLGFVVMMILDVTLG